MLLGLAIVFALVGCGHSHAGRRGGPAELFRVMYRSWERGFEESEEGVEPSASADDRSQYPPNVSAHVVSGRTDASVARTTTTTTVTRESFDSLAAKRQLAQVELKSCAARAALPKGYVRVSIKFAGITGAVSAIDIVDPTVGDGARHCVEGLLKNLQVPAFNRDEIAITHTWFVTLN